MPKDAVKKGSNPKKTTPQKKEATKSPVATKEKTASKQKNQINGDDKKQNKKRKLEEREDKIVEQENVEQIAEQNESKEEVEEQKVKEQEPVQKKQKTNNSDGKTVLIAQYLRVNNEAIMRTLTKELKLDVASLEKDEGATAKVTLKSSKQRNKILQSHRVVRIGNSDVVFSVPPEESVDKQGLFVDNISVKVTEDILKACFKEIAPVKKIIFLPKPQAVSKTAIVLFKKQISDDALEYNGAPIEERNISVRFLREEDKRVYVKQVAKDVSNDELKQYLSEIGELEFIALISDQQDKSPNMFAAQFKDYAHAAEALEYSGADIHGRACSITPEEPSKTQKVKGTTSGPKSESAKTEQAGKNKGNVKASTGNAGKKQ